MPRRLFVPMVLIAASLGVAAWWMIGNRQAPVVEAAKPDPPPAVSVSRVNRQDLRQEIVVTGELIPYQEVEVMAKVSGYVRKIYVDVGDSVRQGQLLAELEVPEMADDAVRASASIQRNRAELRRGDEELKRAQSAYQMAHLTATRLADVAKARPGLVAQQEVDDAQSRDLMAAAQVAAARSALAVTQEQIKVAEADHSRVKTMINYSRVVAPFDGVVTKRYADNGAMVQAGTASQTQAMPVVRLSQNSQLRLVVPVPESAAGAIRLGAGVDIRIPSLQRNLTGRVARYSDKVDTSTRTMITQVDVPNAGRLLKAGSYAEVKLVLAESRRALAAPVQAVRKAGGRRVVNVVDTDGKVEEREVTVGLETPTEVEIRSGVSEGEMVVTAYRGTLTVGQIVTPLASSAARKGAE